MNKTCSAIGFFYCCAMLAAQAQQPPPPPRPISVYADPQQGLVFGTIFRGPTGGNIIIYPDGSRSVTGDLIESNLGPPFSSAFFEVEANPGTVVSILNGPDVVLHGSNGGTAILEIGDASTGSPFITLEQPPVRTMVRIGGVLRVGGPLTTISGVYSGSFYVTFIQQ
jgi:hypothetical protein